MLTKARSSPDVNKYLAYIFSNGPSIASMQLTRENILLVRSSAAINLKNTIGEKYKDIPDAIIKYVQAAALAALSDPIAQIRNFAGSVITEIVHKGGVLGWPDLLPGLISLAANERGTTPEVTQEGAISALSKVCEDNKTLLNKDYNGQFPLDFIIPKLLQITSSPSAKVRAVSLSIINAFIPKKSRAIVVSIDPLLSRLFQLAADPDDEVRRHVCRSFVQLVDARPDKIQPHLAGLVDYIVLQQRSSDDPDLALEAAEFWLCVGENDRMCPALAPYLPKIVPILLESMVYSEDDILRFEGEEDDADREDREEDIKPQFATPKAARVTSEGQNGSLAPQNKEAQNTAPNVQSREDDLSEGEIEDEDLFVGGNDHDLSEDEWNLRKCSAAALDVLASHFHEPVFAVTLPYLIENLQHTEWPRREAAVLAIGAIADGCMDTIVPHLPQLIPYLISLLDDTQYIVRVITCWALGRYSSWASHLPDPDQRKRFFEPMMEGILKRMLDNNKRVQESAASAFAQLEERATVYLTPYCGPIIQQFVKCFKRYKDRNMFILYDCVRTLAEHTGPALSDQNLISLLMPAIIERWQKVQDNSREMFPLLECLSFVALALGPYFAPFASPIFDRCIKLIHRNLEEFIIAANNELLDKPDKDFQVTSLDLLSAIIQALQLSGATQLVARSQPKLFDLLIFCMEDSNNDVRQSAYALLGDCAVNVFPQLKPSLPSILPILIAQLDVEKVSMSDDTAFSVINNACWSCGEIAMQEREGMVPYLNGLYYRLMAIIGNPEVPTSVNENAAIALGRLGVGCSDALSAHLAEFAQAFLQIIQPLDDTDEKGHAIFGFNLMVEKNPRALGDCLLDYFRASAAYSKVAKNSYESGHDIQVTFHRVSPNVVHPIATTDYYIF